MNVNNDTDNMADAAAVSSLLSVKTKDNLVNSGDEKHSEAVADSRTESIVRSGNSVDAVGPSVLADTSRNTDRIAVLDGWHSQSAPRSLPDKSSHQSGTDATSSGIQSPDRLPRAHSVAGRQPSYAQPTVASLLRMSRSNDLLDGAVAVPLCPRCRPRSASPPVLFRNRDLYRPLRYHRLTTSASRPRSDLGFRSGLRPQPDLGSRSRPPRSDVAPVSKPSMPHRPVTPSDKSDNRSFSAQTRPGHSLSSLTSDSVANVPASEAVTDAGSSSAVTSTPRDFSRASSTTTNKLSRTLVKSLSADKSKPSLKTSASSEHPGVSAEPSVSKSKSTTNVKKHAKSRIVTADKEVTKKETKTTTPVKPMKVIVSKDTTVMKVSDTSTDDKTADVKDMQKTSAAVADNSVAVEEYRAKMAEKRRLAREKAELELAQEAERRRQQQAEEEERARREEEEERAREAEELRLAEESRRAEEERLQQAMAEEQRRRELEEQRLEAERLQRLEAERLAKEDAERLEAEHQAKLMRDEQEKLERKKRLESIMKRVKPEESTAKDDSVNGKNPSSSAVSVASQDISPVTDTPVLSKLSVLHSDIGSQQFKSPRLQQLLGNRTATAGSQNPSALVKSSDSMLPAEQEDGTACLSASVSDSMVTADSETPQVDTAERSETLDVTRV